MTLTAALKAEARRLGIDLVGVAPAYPFAAEAAILAERTAAGHHWPFTEPDIARRTRLEQLLPGVRSIVAAGLAYGPSGSELRQERSYATGGGRSDAQPGGRGWLSRYCRGLDYHQVLRNKLEMLTAWLRAQEPAANVLVCVDTAPPLDRAAAQRAGLGFFGHSANLITRDHGTWVFLGEILTDIELEPDEPGKGTCGSCARCLDACPTGALLSPGILDSAACLSYLTQIKGYVPEAYRAPMGNMLFGCDICQDVCPYNLRAAVPGTPHPEFRERPVPGEDAGPPLAAILSMTQSQFRAWFRPTAAAWRGKTVLQRNAVIALGNSGDPRAVDLLATALADQRPVIRGHTAWALARLATTGAEKIGDRTRIRAALEQLAASESDGDVQRELAAALKFLA